MSDQPVYVVSDIHLGSVPATTERRFRDFLAHVAGEASELLINGDLFDFWFEYRSVIPAEHYRVLAALTDLRESGVRIRFLGGNHDAWAGAFLRDRVGMELLKERAELELAGFRAMIVHGDGVGRGDLGYRILKRVIRNPASTTAFRLLHPDFGARIASKVSTTDAKREAGYMANPVRAAALRSWAAEQLDLRPDLDLVLAGHTHSPTVDEVHPGRFYVNTGDWLNRFNYLVLRRGERPELREWPSA